MTFAELMSMTPADRWRSLSPEAQARIGTKIVEHHFADLVAYDDGLETSEAEREQASEIRDRSFNELFKVIEAEFPDVLWTYPEGTFYEARDRHGAVVGVVDSVAKGWRFQPASPHRRAGKIVGWETPIAEALPAWVKRIVANGGWFGAVLPDTDEPTAIKARTRFAQQYKDRFEIAVERQAA